MLRKLPERFRVRAFTLIKTIRSLYSTAVRPSSCPEISSNFSCLRIWDFYCSKDWTFLWYCEYQLFDRIYSHYFHHSVEEFDPEDKGSVFSWNYITRLSNSVITRMVTTWPSAQWIPQISRLERSLAEYSVVITNQLLGWPPEVNRRMQHVIIRYKLRLHQHENIIDKKCCLLGWGLFFSFFFRNLLAF
jgi:hypothetical protein